MRNYKYTYTSLSLIIMLLFVMPYMSFYYGITFDEIIVQSYGEQVYMYFSSLGEHKTALNMGNYHYYGGLFDLLCVIFEHIFNNFDTYDVRHVLNSLFGVVCIFYTWLITKTVYNSRAALISIVLMLGSLRIFGHMMNNPKDAIFATLFFIGFYQLVKIDKPITELSFLRIIIIGVSIGLSIAVRIGGLLLLFYLSIIIVYYYFSKTQKYIILLKSAIYYLIITGISLLVASSAWPWALQNPFIRIPTALLYFKNFEWDGPTLFEGELILASKLPWYYEIKYFLISTPEFIILGFTIALIFVLININWKTVSLIFTIIFPILFIIINDSRTYDGIRHLLFLYPLIVIVSAFGIECMIKISSKYKYFKNTTYVFLLGFIILSVYNHIIYFPFQSTYFNQFAGGYRGASLNYETDYWGNCIKYALINIKKKHASSDLTISGSPRHLVASQARRFGFSYTDDRIASDYFISNLRGYSSKQIYEIQKIDNLDGMSIDGSPVCIAIRLDPSSIKLLL